MRSITAAVVFIALLSRGALPAGEAPQVVESNPGNGAQGVPVDIGRIVIVFDRNMKMNSWSLLEVPGRTFPPLLRDGESWSDPLTFVLRVDALQPRTAYAFQLNSEKRKGFASAQGQVPLPATVISFTTGDTTAEADAPGATDAAPAVSSDQAGPTPLLPPLPLAKHPRGHIVFSRAVLTRVAVPGAAGEIPLLKLFVMNGDGTGQKHFLAPDGFATVKEPRWSPGYDLLAFSSDWNPELSACVHDVFVAPAAGGPAVRLTGNELHGPAPLGYGLVTGLIRDNTKTENWNIDRPASAINITAQGAGVIVHPGDLKDIALLDPDTREKIRDESMRAFIIPKVAAGQKVWVKIWVTRNMGHLVFADVRPGAVTDIGAVEVNECNYAASRPSLAPGGRLCVGMGHLLSIDPTAKNEYGAETGQLGGAEAITVWDMKTGMTVASLDPLKVQALSAKDPVVSPDGRFIACGLGQPFMEDLALIGLDDLVNGRPQPRVLVRGERILPSEMTFFKAASIGASTPGWAPDGRQIAFCRLVFSEDLSGDLWIVKADGSQLRQLTHVAPNQVACQPCFSPDGRRVAFTVLSGKWGAFKLEHFITLQFTANVYSINVDGSDLQQLTRDGGSCEPAWGP